MKPTHRELHRLLAITAGVVLIVWAVADVLPWLERIALIIGVALMHHTILARSSVTASLVTVSLRKL